jgi:hypothetical protein
VGAVNFPPKIIKRGGGSPPLQNTCFGALETLQATSLIFYTASSLKAARIRKTGHTTAFRKPRTPIQKPVAPPIK